jgi:arylesterase/paraoxonase
MTVPHPCRLILIALTLAACGSARGRAWPPAPMQARQCTTVALPQGGSEDIVVDEEAGVAFISNDPRHVKGRPGAIYAYPLDGRDTVVIAMDTVPLRPFRPHGMGLFTAANGERRLFVVNHGKKPDAVEIFRVHGARLVHDTTIQDPRLLVRGNDVAPVGPRSFYVTNSQVSRTEFGRAVENLLTWGHSSVLFYDGTRFTRIAGGLTFANGVNVSADGRHLYASASRGKDLRVYSRADGRHALVRRIRAGTALDNIEMDSTGGLWVATHSSLFAFVRHGQDTTRRSPSQVLFFPVVDGIPQDPVLVAREAELPSGASVAVRRGNQLLVGSVYGPVQRCTLTGTPPT